MHAHTENTEEEKDKPFMNHTRSSQILSITLSTSKTQFPLEPLEHKQENSEALYEKSPISKKTRTENKDFSGDNRAWTQNMVIF